MKKKKQLIENLDKYNFIESVTQLRQNAELSTKALKKYYKRKSELKKKLKEEVLNLEFCERLKTSELISDLRYFKRGFFGKLSDKLKGKALVQCIVHMDNGNDVVRFFPIYRNNVVDINRTLYMFSPDSFRFINGIPTLYFYQGLPFSILLKVKENIPTLDAKAFTSIQKSKFISDALEGDTGLENKLIIVCLIFSILSVIAVIVSIVMMADGFKKLGI